MRSFELQDNNNEAKKIRAEKLPKNLEDIEKKLYY